MMNIRCPGNDVDVKRSRLTELEQPVFQWLIIICFK